MALPKLNYKKIILVVGFLATSIFFGWLIYMLFFRQIAGPPVENINEDILPINEVTRNLNVNGRLPLVNVNIPTERRVADKTAQGGITKINKLTKSSIEGATLDLSGERTIFYNQDDGKFYGVDKNGNMVLLSEKTFFSVQSVNWSPGKEMVVLEYPDGSNIVYDFATDEQITLPQNWEEFGFSSEKQKIATKNFDLYSKNNQLIIADVKSGGAKIIESLGDKADSFQINWSPDNQVVAFFVESVDFNHQEVFLIGQHDENFKSIIVDGHGFKGKWSPDGTKILYSVYNSLSDYKPTLWIVNKNGSFKKIINVSTWVDKCTFYNNNIIYCGVPQRLEKMMGPSPNLAIDINDDIYRIDLRKNFTERIAIPETGHNVEKLIITDNEKTLYFTDRRTGRLYKIDL